MMSCAQAIAFIPNTRLGVDPRSSRLHPSFCRGRQNNVAFRGLVCSPSKNSRLNLVCLAQGSSKSENEGFSWESLKNAMGGMKQEENVQDWLKKQMRQNEFDGDGGDGGRAGGGGDGNGDDEESFSGILDEMLQVILATIGFVFVYIYLIRGAELTRLARDYVKYLFGSSPSMRLTRSIKKWERFCNKFIVTVDTRDDWLERAIVATPTWWHKPRKLARLMRSRDDY